MCDIMIVEIKSNTNPYGRFFLATEAPDDEEEQEAIPKKRNVKVVTAKPDNRRRRDFTNVSDQEDDNNDGETTDDEPDFTDTEDENTTSDDAEDDGPETSDDEPDFTDTDGSDDGDEENEDESSSSEDNNDNNKAGVDLSSTRKYNLYKEYMSLYNSCNNYISKLENVIKDDKSQNQIIRISVNNLRKIKDILYDYMTIKFTVNSYVQSLLFYQKMVVSVQLVFKLLASLRKNDSSKSKQ